MKIKTDRLILRLFDENDIDSYYNILKQKTVYQWLGKGQEISKEHVKKIIKNNLNHWKKHKIGTWAVILKSDNSLIGHCGFNYLKELNHYELLYAFDQNHWGKGYGSEACQLAIHWLKAEGNIKNILALSYPNNHRSIHVIKKLGFHEVGTETLFGVNLLVYQKSI
ncbi:MAG: GNAT family N-acetyltransferase [Nanoarchaeota archaeon]